MGFAKVEAGKGKLLSKSQKRKLKKLEDNREKKDLLSKSVKILEKCKISQGVYECLLSTRNLGQPETSKQKRRRVALYSQAGLELNSTDIFITSETKDEPDLSQVYEDDTYVDSTLQPLDEDKPEGNNIPSTMCSIEDVQSIGVALSSADTSSCIMNKASALVEQVPIHTFGSTSTTYEEQVPNHTFGSTSTTYDVSNHSSQGSVSVVCISRPKSVISTREGLPVFRMEQEIMEAINNNPTVIICGETGSGKTTQVPQFLYEAGYGSKQCSGMRSGMIGVTQPRRVAVYATYKRVKFELGCLHGKKVGYQVRYDNRTSRDNCSIKFMTDGILLQELKSDFFLKRYSVIILDEAHERSINTDILIGMLSKVVKLRQEYFEEQKKEILEGKTIDDHSRIFPLKLILMSATFKEEDFTLGGRIFHKIPPIIRASGREHRVVVHFSRRTNVEDYITPAYKKVLSIHKRLPPGGILVFVTGQKEVEDLCRMLRNASVKLVRNSSKFDGKEISIDRDEVDGNGKNEIEGGDGELDFSYQTDESESDESEAADDDLAQVHGENGNNESLNADLAALEGKTSTTKAEPSQGEKQRENNKLDVAPMRIFPLYAMLPLKGQRRIFCDAEKGERRVVVATNVAETSLTIPGISYVVDTGREKVKEYNSSGIETFKIQWISKASAEQRKGRAGRTGPGHCYRLYSSAVFTNFPPSSPTAILNTPLDSLLLLLKSLNIWNVAKFPFPTPPEPVALAEAERVLKALEALDKEKGTLTPLGRAMSQYPMSPRHSRMLITAIQSINKDCVRSNLVMGYAVAAAAALNSSNPFIFQLSGNTDKQDDAIERKKLRKALGVSRGIFSNIKSDALTTAYALQCFECSEDLSDFCANHTLSSKVMGEMSKLRLQLLHLVFQADPKAEQNVVNAWKVGYEKFPLTRVEEGILLRAICAGWVDRVAKRIKIQFDKCWEVGKKVKNGIPYEICCMGEAKVVYLHNGSTVSKSAPDYLVYNELVERTGRHNNSYIYGASSVEPEWLAQYGASMCTFSAPLTHPKPGYDSDFDQVYCYVKPSFGPLLWELPYHQVPIPPDGTVSPVDVFAFALLDGQVLPCLKSKRKLMAADPSIILSPEYRGQTRVGNLLIKLHNCSIHNGFMLREAWEKKPDELYAEIRCWFPAKFHEKFVKLWEMMQQEAKVSKDK